MFTTKVTAHRHARIWAGGVLLVGAVVLYAFARTISPFGILAITWSSAALAYALAHRFHPAMDPRRLALASILVPAIGLLAVLPLSLHALAFLSAGETTGFDWWVRLSLIFTAIPTVTTTIFIVLRGCRLVEGRPSGALSPWALYGYGVAASLIPGVLLISPVVLIAVTGLAMVPVFYAMELVLVREHARLERGEIPEAIARFREVL